MTIKLYRHPLSGHSHRAELMLSLLGLQAELIDVDLLNGAHKKPEFLALNSFGQVPVLDDNGTVISDSNGILVYLARRYDKDYRWFPLHPAVQAEVQRFLSVAAGPVAFGPAAARLVNVFGAGLNHQEAIDRAEQILESLNEVLAERQWLAGDLTIADVACYTYIAHAPEGDIDLSRFPAVVRWLEQVEALPGFVPMQATPVGLAA